ncbi:MAG: patatin-like phospholipase family protein [Patescibacteria group bacterium]
MKNEKVAIITSGGGMKCAYSAGALVALARELKITNPDIFVSASGSVGAMFYYLAEQYDDIEKAWTKFIPSRQFIRYAPFPALRINYLVDTISKTYLPLDVEKAESSNTQFFVPVTDTKTGETKFIDNHLWMNPYEIIRAATAIPLLYNGHVNLGGKSYLDGDFSSGMVDLIDVAIKAGATRILCITNTDAPTKIGKFILRTYGALLSPGLRKAMLRDMERGQTIEWPDGIKFTLVSPTFTLPTVLYSRERRKVVEAFTMGYEDLLAKRDEIEELFRLSPARDTVAL